MTFPAGVRFVATLLTTIVAVPALAGVASFSELGPREVLEVRYSVTSCFSGTTYLLVFRPRPATVTMTIMRVSPRDLIVTPTSEITAALPDSDLAGLDALIEHYRGAPPATCTTTEVIEVDQLHEGRVVASERFVDGSCGTSQLAGVLTLNELTRRLSWIRAGRRESR